MTLAAPNDLAADGIVLRRFTHHDIAAFGDFMAQPENTQFMTFPDSMKSRAAAGKIIEDTIRAYATPNAAMALAICRNDDPTIIGACGAFERNDREIEIFYLIFEAHRRQGYATAAARTLKEHLLLAKPGHDLTASIHPNHAVSATILEGLGFVDGGRRTENGITRRRMLLAARHVDR